MVSDLTTGFSVGSVNFMGVAYVIALHKMTGPSGIVDDLNVVAWYFNVSHFLHHNRNHGLINTTLSQSAL